MLTLGEKLPGNGSTWARKLQIPGDGVRRRIPLIPQGFLDVEEEAWLEPGAWQWVGSWGHTAALQPRWEGGKYVMPVRVGAGCGML